MTPNGYDVCRFMESDSRLKWKRVGEEEPFGCYYHTKNDEDLNKLLGKQNDYRAKILATLYKYAYKGQKDKFDYLSVRVANKSKPFRQILISEVLKSQTYKQSISEQSRRTPELSSKS